MNADRTHPSSNQLAAFDAGQLPAHDQAAIEQHVTGCPDCCRFLESLPEDALAERIRGFVCRSTAATQAVLTTPGVTAAPAERVEVLRDHPRYRILGLLGTGGMGTVYRAVQVALDRVVALKVLHRPLTDRPGFTDQFHTEVKTLARLNHPNVVAAYDADRAGDLHFLVMEYVEGESLDAVVARRGPLPVAEACDLARQVAVGLQHAHAHGLVHRDVKPSNLLLTRAGAVKIADFGLARLAASDGPSDHGSGPTVLGTPEYMAPEQAREPHRADIRSDLYALGCTLYFLLSGRPPFVGASRLQILLDHQDVEPAEIPGLPRELSALLDRLLAKDPTARFSTPAEVADALERAADATEVAPPPRRRPRRWPIAAGTVALAAAVASVAIAYSFKGGEIPAPKAFPDPVPLPIPRGPEAAPLCADPLALASPEQLDAMRREPMERLVAWVRENNRWNPNADIAVQVAARVANVSPGVDGFQERFGSALVKSRKPTLLFARTGAFFRFELSPEQATGADLGAGIHVTAKHAHPIDARRVTPRVRLADLQLDDADAHPSGARIEGTVTCEFPTAPGADECLRITYYRSDSRRVTFVHQPKPAPASGRVKMRFSADPIERLSKVDGRLFVVFADWISGAAESRVIESNTLAVLLLQAARY